jgi:hypothetical protein
MHIHTLFGLLERLGADVGSTSFEATGYCNSSTLTEAHTQERNVETLNAAP